ncbi:metallophosphoesterase [Campylobacter blaseri]|uniref:metallophosphoesterase n=1 Tax=Campylobacter blaseri TaxID=2042961 RepID=UPI001F4E42A7|nr:metallophosphoesterase [Campylobacter blaseri]
MIGDVHGEYEMLLELVDIIPKKSRIIFVGDVIDRGSGSKKVLEYIKTNKFECVMGNHEFMMINAVKIFLKHDKYEIYWSSYPWFNYGGKEALISFGININYPSNKISEKEREILKNVLKFLETLPLYLELNLTKNNLPVVISHAFIGEHWHRKDDKKIIEEVALWNTKMPYRECKIFNIFGHTPHEDVLEIYNCVDVDTGCGFGKKLSAYCVESGEVLSVNKAKSKTIFGNIKKLF